MTSPLFGVGSGGANPNSSKSIDKSRAHSSIIAASYFDRGVVGDDIYRDLTGNNVRCLPVTQLQDFVDAINSSGDTTSHQGYTTDGTFHYTFDTADIYKHTDDATWKAGGAGPDKVDSNTTPFTSLESGSAHIGDGVYHNSQLIVPVTNGTSSAPFLSQIAIYDVSAGLPYAHHVTLDTSIDVAGVAYNSSLDELYVVAFYDNYSSIFVYDLSDILAQSAGSAATLKRTITLNFPSYQTQGIFYKSGQFYISQNEGDIFVYDAQGRFDKSYYIHGDELGGAGGVEGIDFSQDELRILLSSGASQGVVYYFDLSSIPAKSQTHTNGERLELYYSLRMIFNSLIVDNDLPDTGTIVTRIKVRSAGTRFFMENRLNSTRFQCRTQDSAFPVKFAGYVNNSVATSADGQLQDTYYDYAFTWDRFGGVSSGSQGTIVVNGVQTVSADDTWLFTAKDIGIGTIHRTRGASGDGSLPDHDCEYWYTYGAVLTLAEINAAHTAIQLDGIIG